jgi:hypothetical protein
MSAFADEFERGFLADQLLFQEFALDGKTGELVGPVYDDRQFIELVGFGEVIVGPVLHGLDGRLDRCLPGEDDDGRCTGVLLHLFHERDPVDTRHNHIEKDDIEGPVAQKAQRLDTVMRHFDSIPFS